MKDLYLWASDRIIIRFFGSYSAVRRSAARRMRRLGVLADV